MIIWIIGKSASGKTSVSETLIDLIKSVSDETWIHLDGDNLRQIQGKNLVDHTISGRKKNSQLAVNICKFLDTQQINMVVSILSIFEEHRAELRGYVSSYKEIYLKVDNSTLIDRDNKNLYKKALAGQIRNFVGVDIEFPEPLCPHLIINNDGHLSIAQVAHTIYDFCLPDKTITYEYSYSELIESPQKYQYTKFYGREFLGRYMTHRLNFLGVSELPEVLSLSDLRKCIKNFEPDIIQLEETKYQQIKDIILNIEQEALFNLLRSFEIRKRIYSLYDNKFKPVKLDEYRGKLGYLLTSFLLSKALLSARKRETYLILLNALCKLNDILIPLSLNFTGLEVEIAKIGVASELRMIELIDE